MKRFLTILLTILALTAALCVSASASSFDEAAEELAAIGVFKGTGGSLALDQVPTRGQAAIMLVRLYGKEPEAQNTYKSGRITCPFTDVNETVAPYVAWLADEGIANGTSETTFGAADPCTAKAYTIFMLRALGYEDGSDFTTATAQDFAASLGIVDTSAISGTFLRDDLAALTYQALATDLKDGSTYLLDYLIKEDFVVYNDAYPILEKIENYRALNAASAGMEKGLATDIDMAMAITTSSPDSNLVEQTRILGKGKVKMLTTQNPQMSCELEMEVDGQKESVKVWLKDGWLYTQEGETGVKMEAPDIMEIYQELLTPSMAKNTGASVLPFLDYINVKTSGSDKVYTLEFNDAFPTMVNSLVAQILGAEEATEGVKAEFELEDGTFTYTVKNGSLREADADLSMTIRINAEEDGKPVSIVLGMTMQMEMDITATGNAVKITFPDFSKFEEVAGDATPSLSITLGD